MLELFEQLNSGVTVHTTATIICTRGEDFLVDIERYVFSPTTAGNYSGPHNMYTVMAHSSFGLQISPEYIKLCFMKETFPDVIQRNVSYREVCIQNKLETFEIIYGCECTDCPYSFFESDKYFFLPGAPWSKFNYWEWK